ncbi:VanW family protein [Neobacillus sp. PS3-40]|uniref:VanW family protein n=1 Tax=Neobacillus sp. PS3-40 TaxID=3070679 RepID=UPI0027E18F0A|nr:VanW family protein [Neobacillus sp. PS3-40]WML44037.1 VanW family protein [Neobacillus sp. PS3-40]
MKKGIWVISIVLTSSLIGLTGCSENKVKEKALEKKVTELQKQVEQEKKSKEADDKAKKQAEQKPIVVNIVDPNTKSFVKSFVPKEMGFGTNNEKYKQEIEKWAKDVARGTQTTPGYDKRMLPDRIGVNGLIVKGSPRTILEESELSEKVLQASEKGGDVELPLYVTQSGYKPEDASHLAEVVVATYSTHFNSSVVGRGKNIELSAQAINNVIIGTGDIFSFNTTVGPSDQEHGYQKAKEAVDGKLVDGIGGGICQTSSTLYNAIDQLGVSYVEKHHHSLHVGYVPTGRDATVSYGGADFRFQNTTGVPLLLKAIVRAGTLTVEVRTSKLYQANIKKGL